MTIAITPIYAIILTLLYLVLAFRVIYERRTQKFAYGDNDSPRIHAKIRAQANWAEYAPIALLLMLMAELMGAQAWALHGIGILLLIGRGMHGYGMSFVPKQLKFRTRGMMLTVISINLLMVLNIITWFLA